VRVRVCVCVCVVSCRAYLIVIGCPSLCMAIRFRTRFNTRGTGQGIESFRLDTESTGWRGLKFYRLRGCSAG
jgi:hypothetical protein